MSFLERYSNKAKDRPCQHGLSKKRRFYATLKRMFKFARKIKEKTEQYYNPGFLKLYILLLLILIVLGLSDRNLTDKYRQNIYLSLERQSVLGVQAQNTGFFNQIFTLFRSLVGTLEQGGKRSTIQFGSFTPEQPTPTPHFSITPTPTCILMTSVQPHAMLIYDAQPQVYDHAVVPPFYSCSWCTGNGQIRNEDKGQTFSGNKNPWGFEIYMCESSGGTITRSPGSIPLDFYAKRDKDICIPQATTVVQDGTSTIRWSQGLFPNFSNLECYAIQHLMDGPNQVADNRQAQCIEDYGGVRTCSGPRNFEIDICTRVVDQTGTNPYLDITVPFPYDASMCQGESQVVLAGREDPIARECIEVGNNPTLKNAIMSEPWKAEYKQYLTCFLYFDDAADVAVCKDGDKDSVCDSILQSKRLTNTMNGIHPAPLPSESLCELFAEGEGDYLVNIKVWDMATQVYGTGDLWLTWSRAWPICPTVTPGL